MGIAGCACGVLPARFAQDMREDIMTTRMALCAAALAAVLTPAIAPPAHAQDSILGEVRHFGFNFCPRGWAPTDGKLMSINQNTALFSLLGTTYGGDGRTTFALPTLTPPPASKPASAPPPETGGEVRVYQHCDYEGWSVPLGLGDHRPADLPAPYADNNVSSLRASPGWQVTLFDGPNLDGQSLTLTGQDACLVDNGFNDRMSSIRVTRLPPNTSPDPATKPAGVMCIAVQGIYPSRN